MKQKENFDPLQPILDRLRKHGAMADMETLTKSGAHSDVLLWHLLRLSEIDGLEGFEAVHGVSRKEVRRAIAAIRRTARLVERINHAVPLFQPVPAGVLHHYADSLERYLSQWGKPPTTKTSYLSYIVWHVKSCTGKFHDREVSSLISAALNEHYDETTHRMWRIRNKSAIFAWGLPSTPTRT